MTRIRVGLGTVQIGVPYGNKSTEPLMPESEAFAILGEAISSGIGFLDTAIAYGESEARIGRYNVSTKHPNVQVSTKIPATYHENWVDERTFKSWLDIQIANSCGRLGVNRLGLLQFHQCDVPFLSNAGVRRTLQQLIDEELCTQIGISVYTVEQALLALEIPAVRALQIPVNIIDNRFLEPLFLSKAIANNITLIVRSPLLQGVLVEGAPLPEVKRRSELALLKKMLLDVVRRRGELLTVQSGAIRFLFGNHAEDLDIVLFGVDSLETLRQNLALIKKSSVPLSREEIADFEAVRQFATERQLFDPSTWNI